MNPFKSMTARARRRLSHAVGVSVLGGAAIALVVLLLPVGSSASKAHAATHSSPVPIGPPPRFSVAARRGLAELLGQDGPSPVAWNSETGLWGGHTKPNWWQSGLALLAIVRYAERTHDREPLIQHVIWRIYDRNVYKPHAAARFDFANEFGDDTGWWGQAWLEASRYELYVRHDRGEAARFLGVAEWDARYMTRMPRSCGGIPWALRRPADAVTSAEFATLTAGLATYRGRAGVFHDSARAAAWLADAERALRWLERTRLVSLDRGRVLDGLDHRCQRIGAPMTYTEGEVADALVQLGKALHRSHYYREAARFLGYTLTPASGLTAGGVLRERCEGEPGACGQLRFHLDIPAYKGIFLLAVSDWTAATGSKEFQSFLRAQARAVVTRAVRDPAPGERACSSPRSCQFGFHWIPVRDADATTLGATVGSQESALDALIAVLPVGRADSAR